MYPAELAELYKGQAGQKYRPSNGTEGEAFFDCFCDRCRNEPECMIMKRTMVLDEDDPSYPQEWQYGQDGQPVCTAFELEKTDGQKLVEFCDHMMGQKPQFPETPEPKEWPCAGCGKLVMHDGWWLETTLCDECKSGSTHEETSCKPAIRPETD